MALSCNLMRGDTKFGPVQAQIPPLPSLSSPFIASFPNEKKIIKSVWNIGQSGQGHSALRPIFNIQSHELPANVGLATTSIADGSAIQEALEKDIDTNAIEIADERNGPSLCIVVVGATGELARSKIFPALFALFYNHHLPKNVYILGYSRTELSSDELRDIIADNLTCRVDNQQDCGDTVKNFLKRVFYQSGSYDSCEGMSKLNHQMNTLEGNCIGNRIFYLAVPHKVLLQVASCVAKNAQSATGWTRMIIEKPFGYDGHSSALETKGLRAHLNEDQIYRIDHRVGKDLIENLTVLRFSNLVFEPLWCRTYIKNVQVLLSEDHGIDGRGRYFDKYGIVRDVVQSHLLHTIALFAMEPPVSLAGNDIRDEKVKGK